MGEHWDVDDFRDLYLDVHREPHRADRFAVRLVEHAADPGFALITLDTGGTLAGFAYGLRHDGEDWWPPDATAPAPAELPRPLFYVHELAVLPGHRRRGHGRRLLDLLLAPRPEPVAVVATPARLTYRTWGWSKIGELTTAGVDLVARPLAGVA